MVHDEDYLLRDTMKQFGQAFAMGCLVITKARDRKAAEDQRVKDNVELQKEVERLQAEINRLNDHTRAEAKHLTRVVFVRGLSSRARAPSFCFVCEYLKRSEQRGALATVCTPTIKSASEKHKKGDTPPYRTS